MILNTFSILSGVGEGVERKLWQAGILTWEDFLASDKGPSFLSSERKALYDSALAEARQRLAERDARYFKNAMGMAEHWRLFDQFKDEALCLDIETNGLPAGAGGVVTVVGFYDRFGYTSLVKGEGLNTPALMEVMGRNKLLITFFGSSFDVPFLERTMPGFSAELPHFDLCFGFRKVGLRGGLKSIEGQLGILRQDDTVGLDGYDAMLLWQRYQRHADRKALDLLVRYNREDTVNLMGMAGTLYSMLRERTGIGGYSA